MTQLKAKRENRVVMASWIRDLPFAKKVFLLLSVTLGSSLITAAVVSGIWHTHLSRKRTVADLRQQAAILAHSGGSALVFQDDAFAAKLLQGLAANPSFVAGRFMDANGEPFVAYPETAVATPSPPGSGADHVFSGGQLDIWHPITLSNQRIGSLWLRTDTHEVRRQVTKFIVILGIAALTALAIGLAISLPLQRSLTQPIRELAQTARKVTRTQRYDLRARINANDELGDLTAAFNGMLEHIEAQTAAMQLSQQQNKDLFESAPIALWEENFSLVKTDIDAWREAGATDLQKHFETHPDLVDRSVANVRVVKVNQMTLDTYKADSETQLRASLDALLTPESHDAFRVGLIAFANGNTVYECQASNRMLDGQERQFVIRWSLPPSCATTWSRVLVSTIDITEQCQARDELRQAHGRLESTVAERTKELRERTQDAEELNRAMVRMLEEREEANRRLEGMTTELQTANKELEAFSYSVSHDLRAPLRAIDGFSMVLLEDHAEQLDSEGQAHLDRIRAATQRMGRLIDDLLGLSRMNRQPLRKAPIALGPIVQQILEQLRAEQPDRRIELTLGELPLCQGDANLLGVVWTNLLANAIKFTSKQPVADIVVGSEIQENECVYFIKDNGAGFDMAYVGKLFGVFQRLHGNSEFPGTGIGLATVQRIIHRHGGRIWAEGKVDQGATFYFTIP